MSMYSYLLLIIYTMETLWTPIIWINCHQCTLFFMNFVGVFAPFCFGHHVGVALRRLQIFIACRLLFFFRLSQDRWHWHGQNKYVWVRICGRKKQSVLFRYQTKAVTVMIKPLLMHYGTFGQHSLEPEPHSKSLPNAGFMIAVPVFFFLRIFRYHYIVDRPARFDRTMTSVVASFFCRMHLHTFRLSFEKVPKFAESLGGRGCCLLFNNLPTSLGGKGCC